MGLWGGLWGQRLLWSPTCPALGDPRPGPRHCSEAVSSSAKWR